MKHTLAALASILCLGVICANRATAQDGYKLTLKLTSKDATHDPDGVWTDDDLAGIRQAVGMVKIYTARVTTASGTWLLSQTNGDCNLQGMCTALLVTTPTSPTMHQLKMSNPQMPLGGTAILSSDTKTLTISEIGENGKPFTGSYDVEPMR